MEIEIKNQGPILIATLQGKLGAFFGVKSFEDEMEKHILDETRYVILDTTNLSFISSAGLRVILGVHKRMAQRQGTLSIVGLQPYCNEVLSVTGIANNLPIFISLQEAIDYCQAQDID